MSTPPHPMVPVPFRIRAARQETHDAFTLELRPANGSAAFPFAAGQFNMLYVFGVGEVPMSITGDPRQTASLVHTIRNVGAVTAALAKLRRGSVLGVRGPFGSRWPVEDAAGKDVVIVAGGMGLAPLRPVVYRLLSDRANYGKVILLYGTRTPEDILYHGELAQWRSRLDLHVEVTVDRAPAVWRGTVGVVTTLIQKASFDPRRAVAMVCGPEVMMRFAARELEGRGVAASQIYVSMERNMKCAVGFCGHCQFGPRFICKDGPVFCYQSIASFLHIREL
jgi:NAD(P)H-flavin reductase